MKLSKIKMLFLGTEKSELHSQEEINFVAECQNVIEINSAKDCVQSIKRPNGMYYIQIYGYCYNPETFGEPNGAEWKNSSFMPFIDGKFNIKLAISYFNMSKMYAEKYFNYKYV